MLENNQEADRVRNLQRNNLKRNPQRIKLIPDPLTMRIGNKNITVILHTNPFQQIMHSFFIQLFKYII